MGSPHKCPVCNGTGKVLISPNMPYMTTGGSVNPPNQACNACSGSGVVWEPDPIVPSPFSPMFNPGIFAPMGPVIPPPLPQPNVFTPADLEEILKAPTEEVHKSKKKKEFLTEIDKIEKDAKKQLLTE